MNFNESDIVNVVIAGTAGQGFSLIIYNKNKIEEFYEYKRN